MEFLEFCIVFSLLAGLAKSRGGRAAPAVPVVTALNGQGVVIPCSTQDPPTHLQETRIYWQGSNPRRSKNSNKDTEVMLVYNKGKVEKNWQTPLYRNRTTIFPDLLFGGNFSLKIDRSETKVNPDTRSRTFSANWTLLLNASEGQIITCFVTNPALRETVNTSVTIQGCGGNIPGPHNAKTASWVVPVAVVVLLVVSVVVFVSIGLRYWCPGGRNRTRGDGSVTGANPEGQGVQGEDNTGHTHTGGRQEVESHELKNLMESKF
ncbi:hypothetical protein SKAU_G00260180 [Synaphobranchus kaupii]|uniref:Ig-like domain-containing protein n=1 Tax=Synaphobranchus kaupii TaxID=118154 RepID=A0A9Q1ISG5_SYNKA|nr:hypothetical protein SKAU_G00260180 [Synaphobranchus kaupii]